MKLLIAIVQAYDADKLLRALTEAKFGATRINSMGGFLRMTNATILMAMNDEHVPDAVNIIRTVAARRVEVRVDTSVAEYSEWIEAGVHEVPIGGGVVFTVPMQLFAQVYPDRILKHEKTPVV